MFLNLDVKKFARATRCFCANAKREFCGLTQLPVSPSSWAGKSLSVTISNGLMSKLT